MSFIQISKGVEIMIIQKEWAAYLITILLMVAVVAAAVLVTTPASADDTITMYCICTDSRVNVREQPSTKAHIGGYLEFGWDVQVSGEVKDKSGTTWYRIDGMTEAGTGYVCSNYLITSKPEKVNLEATVRASGRVATYKRVDGKRKGWAKAGSKLTISVYSDDWCLTNKGYIRTEYLHASWGW